MRMPLSAISVSLLGLVGCSTLDPNYSQYLQASQQIAVNHKPDPLFRMKACSGCVIELKGVDELVVNSPDANKVPQIQQVKDNEWVGVARATIQTLGAVGGTAVLAGGAVDIAREIKNAGTAGYPYVQAPISPQANISNSYNTQGDNSAVGGNATTSASGSGSSVGGSGSYVSPVSTASGDGSSTGGSGSYTSPTNTVNGSGSSATGSGNYTQP